MKIILAYMEVGLMKMILASMEAGFDEKDSCWNRSWIDERILAKIEVGLM